MQCDFRKHRVTGIRLVRVGASCVNWLSVWGQEIAKLLSRARNSGKKIKLVLKRFVDRCVETVRAVCAVEDLAESRKLLNQKSNKWYKPTENERIAPVPHPGATPEWDTRKSRPQRDEITLLITGFVSVSHRQIAHGTITSFSFGRASNVSLLILR